MNKTLLVSITLFILIIGIGCASAADLSQSSTDSKDSKGMVSKVDSTKSLSTKKAAVEKVSSKKTDTKKVSKKAVAKKVSSKKDAVKKTNVKKAAAKKTTSKKVSKKAAAEKVSSKKTDTKKVSSKNTVKPVDKVIRGWNPKDHEVSRKSLGGGLTRITYDDGYFRVVDGSGNILSYGF